MGIIDKIKDKLKGNKKAEEGLEKAKEEAGKAIDTAAKKANIDPAKTEPAKKVISEQVDKVKAELGGEPAATAAAPAVPK